MRDTLPLDMNKLSFPLHPNAERFDGVTYGRSPVMSVLDDIKAWNALTPEQRAKAIRGCIDAALFDDEAE